MFLTFVTRCCRRPEALRQNIESVRAQDSDDWEQLFLVDPSGRHKGDPILFANKQFARYAKYVQGDYVYPLDDDVFLIENAFVSTLQRRALDHPDAILVKARVFNLDQRWRVHPEPPIWNLSWEAGQRPKHWVGTGPCIISRQAVWRRNIEHYQHTPGGDWHYITSLLRQNLRIGRLNMVASEAPERGCGVIFEKCDNDWFKPIKEDYELERVAKYVWRLTP
jgi:hypothetical protein